jgi:hypothetical protein
MYCYNVHLREGHDHQHIKCTKIKHKPKKKVVKERKPKQEAIVAVCVLTVKIRQPSHEFTFGVGMNFIPYPLVLTPVV